MPEGSDRARAFAAGELGTAEEEVLVLSLFAGELQACAELAALLRPDQGSPPASGEDPASSEVLDRIFAAAREKGQAGRQERQAAAAARRAIEALPAERRLPAARERVAGESPSPALCEELVGLAWRQRHGDAAAGIAWAELAVAAAERLDGDDRTRVEDVRGRARACFGNALRIASDPHAAAVELQRAGQHLARGSGDLGLRADLLSLRADLANHRARFAEALRLSRAAEALYRRLGARRQIALCWLDRGQILADCGREREALTLLERAAERFRQLGDARAATLAEHNRLYCLVETGRAEEALERLEVVRSGYDRERDALSLLRLQWTEAKARRGSGEQAAAEQLLRQVIAGLADRRLVYDSAFAALDLCQVLLERGRAGEAQQTAASCADLFARLGAERELIVALTLAVDAKPLTATVLARVLRRLQETQRHGR